MNFIGTFSLAFEQRPVTIVLLINGDMAILAGYLPPGQLPLR